VVKFFPILFLTTGGKMDDIQKLNELIEKKSIFVQKLKSEIAKVIVGQEYLVDRLLVGLLSDGHILIEGVPGLAKTYTVKSLANAVKGAFQRIQFTPDLLPADITGTMIFNQKKGEFVPKKGPIFANFILADEINRAPPKVQSALLEAMQERQVTIGDTTYKLPDPFLVLATQNPIEQEGTYPLPEAQVDRFMLKIKITYPERTEEMEIINRMTAENIPEANAIIDEKTIREAKSIIHTIYVDEKIKDYVLDIVFATRTPEKFKLEEIKNYIQYGASPRASIYLIDAARSFAFIQRRGFVIPEDIKAVADDILRHRIILTYEAEAEEITTEHIIKRILGQIEVP